MTAHRSAAPAKGMTLIELMVGLAVGLFVSVVAVTLFASTRTLASVGTSGTRMSENGRLAMDMLHRDLRNAGFQGCKSENAEPPISKLKPANNGGKFLDTGTTGVVGYRGTGAGFSPALSGALTAAAIAAIAVPSNDSDVLSLRVPIESVSLALTAPMTLSTGTPQVGAGNIPAGTIVQGSIVMIGSCKAATIFQVTEANPPATGALTHDTAGSNPGNVDLDLRQVYRGDAAVWPMQTHHYFVAPSVDRPGTRSLWRYAFPASAGKVEPDLEEVAAGIEKMAISYGVAKPTERNLNRYVAADAVTNWDDEVLAVRIQLLAATAQDGVSRSLQTVQFAGSAVTATDHRLRTVLTEVVTLRNRAR